MLLFSRPVGLKHLPQSGSTQSSVPQWRAACHCLCRLKHIHYEEQSSLIIYRHTKPRAPKQYRIDSFMKTSTSNFYDHHVSLRPPSSFQIPASKIVKDVEEKQSISSTFLFPPLCENRPILKPLFVQSLSLTLLMLSSPACHWFKYHVPQLAIGLSTQLCKKYTN